MTSIKTNKVAIYCRLSRDDGDISESSSITNQKEMLIEYAKNNNWDIYNIYIDDGYSGGNFNRPGWNKLLEDLKDKNFNILITKDLSRLGRNYLETGYYTEEFFPENNIRYIAVNDNYDSNNEDNDLTPFKNIINQWYLKDISKKVKQVNHMRMSKGKLPNGYKIPLYGYKHDENNERIIDDESSKNIIKLFEMYADGISTKNISEYFFNNKIPTPAYYNFLKYNYNPNDWLEADDYKKYYWKKSVIARIISNKQYLGILELGKTKTISYKTHKRVNTKDDERFIFENRFPPIISKEVYARAQNIKKNRSKSAIKEEDNPYYNFLFCGTCGKALSLNVNKNKSIPQSYVCRRTICTKPVLIQLKHIDEIINIEINQFINYFLDNKHILKEEIININKNKIKKEDILKEIEINKNKKYKLETYIKRLFEKSIIENMPDDLANKMLNNYQKELNETNKKLNELMSKKNNELSINNIEFEEFINYLRKIKNNKISRKTLLSIMDGIDVIRINKTTIKLKYRYKSIGKFVDLLQKTINLV